MDLRLKFFFTNEEITKEYFALHYKTDFTFKKHMLVVEIDENEHNDRNPDYEKRTEKELAPPLPLC